MRSRKCNDVLNEEALSGPINLPQGPVFPNATERGFRYQAAPAKHHYNKSPLSQCCVLKTDIHSKQQKGSNY